jgi:hypothetical protein
MSYEQVKHLKPTDFKRLCGVSPATFKDMVTVVAVEKVWQKKTGRPSKLSTEDQILMTLEYWRGAGEAPPPGNIVPIFILALIGALMKQLHYE